MSTNKTEHLNLHRWEAADPFLREEFNENFAAIDGFAGAADHIVAGTYDGNDAASREIDLGFAPKAVLLLGQETTNSSTIITLLALPGLGYNSPYIHSQPSIPMFTLTERGFTVVHKSYPYNGNTYYYSPAMNRSGWLYRYLAVQ